ncbi:hypothetical protein [Yinghuangia sp. YIM S10712]|uniref:hypothetical protein n=1 Tax=Yinghuangia sp. YIM S10712 TaxID=3436930 RepID=UPI003F529AAA
MLPVLDTAARPEGAYGSGHRNICLLPAKGVIILDVVDDVVMFVEVLDRPEVKASFRAL